MEIPRPEEYIKLYNADTLEKISLFEEIVEWPDVALHALKIIDGPRAIRVALNILENRIYDVYYQAWAFDVLYGLSLADALMYISKNATTEDWYVFKTMLSQVGADAGAEEGRDLILEAASILRSALSLRPPEEIAKMKEDIEFFKNGFPDA